MSELSNPSSQWQVMSQRRVAIIVFRVFRCLPARSYPVFRKVKHSMDSIISPDVSFMLELRNLCSRWEVMSQTKVAITVFRVFGCLPARSYPVFRKVRYSMDSIISLDVSSMLKLRNPSRQWEVVSQTTVAIMVFHVFQLSLTLNTVKLH